ncbi:MAG: class I SAM-dependent methyltransferase [Candidatus Baldrarchaeia archaeon]
MNKKLRVKEYYDAHAPFYDARYENLQNMKYRIVLSITSSQLEGPLLVSDLGCGTGNLCRLLSDCAVRVVGVDISAEMLKIAKFKIRSSNVELICADVENLPIRDEMLDVVFCITVIQNIPNVKMALSEIVRVGKNRSYIAISTLRKTADAHVMVSLLEEANIKIESVIDDTHVEDIIFAGQLQKYDNK